MRGAASAWAEYTLAFVAGAALFVGRALWAGQDANWDLQNYHDYAGYALLHWRYGVDVGAGGIQGYFNPLPYVTPYALRAALPPMLAAAALATLQAAVAPAVWAIARALPVPGRHPASVRILATLVGVTTATALSEAGTSFADLPLAALVLGAVTALLRADRADRSRATTLLLLSGILIGMAVGLKPTNAVYGAGLAAALLVPWRCRLHPLRAAGYAGAGLLAGIILTGGAWAAYLWATLDNPIFPSLNTVFRSSSAAIDDFTDQRFRPASLLGAIAYPFQIALGQHPTAEIPFREPRFALALLLSGASLWLAQARRRQAKTLDNTGWRATARVAAFLWAAFIAWLCLFAIQRYASALEMLAGVLLVHLAAAIVPARAALASAAVAAALAIATTQPPDWWRRPWQTAYTPAPPLELNQPAAFLVVSHPTGYWASALPASSRFYALAPASLATGGVLHQRIVDGLRTPPGGRVWTLGSDIPMDGAVRTKMAEFGFAPSAPCLRAPSLWWVDTIFCRAAPVGRRPFAAADLRLGQTVDFTHAGTGWIYEMTGWADAWQAGTATTGSTARLVFQPEPSANPQVLEFTVTGRAEAAEAVRIALSGAKATNWDVPYNGAWNTRTLCLPPAAGQTADVTFEAEGALGLGFVLHSMVLRPPNPGECSAPAR